MRFSSLGIQHKKTIGSTLHLHYIYAFSRRFYPKRLPKESFTSILDSVADWLKVNVVNYYAK